MRYSDPNSFSSTDVAIVGLSARFPGASSYNEFWDNLLQEKETISFFATQNSDPQFVNAKPCIENSDKFDADFFKVSTKEAILMDPQHRLLLQCAWHAFEDAGYMPNEIKGQVGVFCTSNFNTYQHVKGWFSHYWKEQKKKPTDRFLAYTGNIQDALAMRISYKLNLKGPSITVQTACSSSLVALHLGCQSLLLRESDMVLVGASALSFPDLEGYYFEPGMILSPDGHCRAFDEKANGVIFGNGVGCVILKLLDRANTDKDYIYGIIKSSAINNDGARKVDFNAPSVVGQQEVIQQAHDLADIDPETISYLEAHGTGTIVGDPIEFEALCHAFKRKTKKKNFCGLGSVKTNLGHLDAASGMASLFKAVLALDREVIPATLHFSKANKLLKVEESPFYFVKETQSFKAGESLRRCAVTNLGIGGTNAHLVLQESPRAEKGVNKKEVGFFLLSAETHDQLEIYLDKLLEHIQKNRKQLILSDVLFTLAVSRVQKPIRCVGFFKSLKELEDALIQNKKKVPSALIIYEFGEESEKKIKEKIPSHLSQKAKQCVHDWIEGKKIIDHPFFQTYGKRRVPLPGYPFQEKRYWYDQIEDLKSFEKNESFTDRKSENSDYQSLERAFITWFAKATGNSEDIISLNDPIEKYNIGSILAISLTEEICRLFAPVSKTLFFEHYCLRDLLKSIELAYEKKEKTKEFVTLSSVPSSEKEEDQIVIVGASCQFPFSNTLEELWDHLVHGRNLVREIPEDRWDHSLYYDEKPGTIGKTYSKWGGFLDSIDNFDPLFFKISPRESVLLDPQERLFLQIAWKTLEDAGYTPRSLNLKTDHSVGVYVGATYQEYQLHGIEERAKGNPLIINGVMSTIPNRVSYFCDFRGPSLVVDTMCSSSLTALSLACQDLSNGVVEAALVGGVNIIPHPNRYLQLAQERLLADDGLCKSFGPGGTGYVPAEGIGCIMIKKMKAAIRDNDHIYGIIKATAINHGGKTNGFTTPNVSSQTDLIRKTLARSKIPPERISYVEAHGTGTTLGDPIEILGLSQAFNTDKKQFCPIGSIKSNMGHAESAAGISGLLKVLLQMKHRMLVPSIHSEVPNENIEFEKTPFYVQRKIEGWTSAVLPRVATVSSFGAGGSNAHVIIEEFEPPIPILKSNRSQFLFVLSARTNERLIAYAKSLLIFLEKEEESTINLEDVEFTLFIGRESMACKGAWICSSRQELLQQLSKFCSDQNGMEIQSSTSVSINDALLNEALAKRDLPFLKHAWLQGTSIDWSKLYENRDSHPKRISLPTYPFEQLNCHFQPSIKTPLHQIHPLVHENISNLDEVRFKSLLNNKIAAIQDHRIGEQVIYPGAAYMEMAFFVCQHILKQNVPFSLTSIVWLKPLYLDKLDLEIFTSVIGDEKIAGVEVWQDEKGKEQIYFQANVHLASPKKPSAVTHEKIFNTKLYDSNYNREECYKKFKIQNFQYGPLYRTIQSIKVGKQEALIEARIDDNATKAPFFIHPALLDAVFQSSIAFEFQNDSSLTYVPTGIQEFHVYQPITSQIFIYIEPFVQTSAAYREYDIKVYNNKKELCLEIKKFREVPLLQQLGKQESLKSVVYAQKVWKEAPLIKGDYKKTQNHLLFASSSLAIKDAILIDDDETCISSQLLSLFERLQKFAKTEKGQPITIMVIFRQFDAWKVTPYVGFFKALAIEQPLYFGKVVLLPDKDLSRQEIEQIINDEWHTRDHFVQYEYPLMRRLKESYEEISQVTKDHDIPFVRQNGIYLITGGSGGLGKLCVQFFKEKNVPCQIILSGKKTVPPDELRNLSDQHVKVSYMPCDVSNKESVKQLVDSVISQHKKIDGIFHLAGINRDSFLLLKTSSDFEQVLQPKIDGLINIDISTRSIPLDYLILFSSDSSVFGNTGQVDYCAANAFMDGFSFHREHLRMNGERKGITKVFNWSYWKEGGMSLQKEILEKLHEDAGVVPIDTQAGFKGLEEIFYSSHTQAVVLQGNKQKIINHLHESFNKKEIQFLEKVIIDPELKKQAADLLRNSLSVELDIEPHLLQDETPFDNFGMNSILSMNIVSSLEKIFGQLPKTLFFEYPTFGSLTRYFWAHHAAAFKKNETLDVTNKDLKKQPHATIAPFLSIRNKKRRFVNSYSADIAIIGIAGKYPQADTLEELWANLILGKNCIEEIPFDRFDYRTIFEENTRAIGKSKSKWGGFLKDVYGFDPLFFKISKDEADRLDPQEKLFLQASWHALEDAGYNREKLVTLAERKVGVYVGSMYQEYQIFNGEQALLGNPIMLGGSASSIANRVSYFLNLIGPSLALDTMCSSSLTAIALACQDISSGKCIMALAGGVNVAVHPNKYQVLTYENFLSSNGLCKSFGEGGDGYVPSEGVGVVLLKSLEKAKRDGDPIYAVIKGIDINHGGQASGFTVPNAAAQAEVIKSAIEQSAIPIEDISYIEAHGTGTALGDPIEISGLSQAFDMVPSRKKIPIGSIKSNIGHCESAAGMAALAKVLLQMQHKSLVPSIHHTPSNPFINFDKLPFTVQKSLEPWQEERRIALISSFGAGGSNACLIIEAYQNEMSQASHSLDFKLSKLFVLSALQVERLKQYAKNFLQFLLLQDEATFVLENLSYTLQTGREAFKERLAIVYEDFNDLKHKLGMYLENKPHRNIFQSKQVSLNEMIEAIGIQEEFMEFLDLKSQNYSTHVIGRLWVNGAKIDWNALYGIKKPSIIHLPTYPFASVPCVFKKKQGLAAHGEKKLHPLLHRNTSTFSQHCLSSTFTGTEPFLRDHVVQGEKVMPGAAIAEMFLSGAILLSGSISFHIENLVWLRTLRMSKDELEVSTVFSRDSNGEMSAQLLDASGASFSQCKLVSDSHPFVYESFELNKLLNELPSRMDAEKIYSEFQKVGFSFGTTYKTLVEIAYSNKSFLAKTHFHPESAEYSECQIPPYFLDAALQATIALSSSDILTLPFCIRKIIVSDIKSTPAWIYGRRINEKMEDGSIYDLFLLDNEGRALISIYGFQDAPVSRKRSQLTDNSIDQLLDLVSQNAIDIEEAEETLIFLSS